jgi:hypothetical protein
MQFTHLNHASNTVRCGVGYGQIRLMSFIEHRAAIPKPIPSLIFGYSQDFMTRAGLEEQFI